MLQQGGNAVDAALATAIALTVVEPTSNGIGADAFALVWDGSRLHGLNGSGRAPASHTLELFRGQGLEAVPAQGWLPVTVPGAPATWRDLHARFGRLPFGALFEPAHLLRRAGIPGRPGDGGELGRRGAGVRRRRGAGGAGLPGLVRDVHPRGRARGPGAPPGRDVAPPGSRPHLRRIAASEGRDFYEGDLAAADRRLRRRDGGHPDGGRPGGPRGHLGGADRQPVPGLRGVGDPAQRAGDRRAGRPEHPGRVRAAGAFPGSRPRATTSSWRR